MKNIFGVSRIGIALFLLSVPPVYSHAVTDPVSSRVLHVRAVDSKIRIDGKMDEEAWQEALKMELNYEVEPGENITPPVRTEVFLIYSRTHLYVGFRAHDPAPSDIRARITDRDNIWNDDFVGITLDTFSAQRRAYTFLCNPFGIQAEMLEYNNTQNTSWDAIWNSAGRVVETGYVVEMAIPFSAMNFQRKKGEQEWRIDAVRNFPRGLPHFIGLVPRERGNNCYLCQLKKVSGFKDVRPGKRIEIAPSLSAVLTQEREGFLEGKFVEKDSKLDPGITARWGVTHNMTLNAAVNPDFSHVEADVAQLDVNVQYALYYPEKRPFFLEGANIFDTRVPAVYTRTLADPEWGIKLTGKEGRHSIGFFSARDGITNLLFPFSRGTDSTSLDMKSMGTVLRYRYDLGRASTLGVLVTDREGDDYFNRLAGVDGYLRFTGHKAVSFQFLGSQTRYPDPVADEHRQEQGMFDGASMDLFFRHSSRKVGYYVGYQQSSPGFRADLGFIPQVAFRNVTGGFIYAWHRNPGHWFTFINVEPQFEYEVDFDQELIYKNLKVTVNYSGPGQTQLALLGSMGKRSVMGELFDTGHVEVSFSMKPNRSFSLGFSGLFGKQIDFENGRGGTRILLNPGIVYMAGRHLSMSLDHTFERFNIDAGRLYTANVSNLKLVYQFSQRAFIRAILQYVDYNFNVANYYDSRDPEFEHFFSQVLFSYKINPRTVLFLGYSDDHYGFTFLPLTQTNRTLFLKIGYALML
jgi:hypothetical protein